MSTTAQLDLRGGKRARSLKYSGLDVATFLSIIDEARPISSSQCAAIAEKYKEYKIDKKRSPRDQDAVKSKFDKMVNVKNQPGSLNY